MVCAMLGLVTMAPICFRGKERNYKEPEKEESFSFREMFGYLKQNKYLTIFFGASLLNGCLNSASGLGMFVSFYLFDDEMFNLFLGALSMVPTLILALLIPKMIKKIDKFKLYYWSSLLSILVGIAIFLGGYENKTLFIVLNVLKAIPAVFPLFLIFMFTPDCAEYGKFKTGIEARGITFAIQTFARKLTGSISTPLGLALIGLFGFVSYEAESFAALSEMGATQTPEALQGLWLTYALFPLVGGILQAVLLLFYKLNDKDVQVMSDCNAGLITREEAEEKLSRKY